jgi:predicted dehydrogenase
MKIGIFSFAHMHAESYVRCVTALPDVELLGIADDDAARGAEFARRHATRFYPSYEALLADRPDGVIICAENARHRRLTELAAAAGAHVLCEKPLATTLADGQAMLAACERAGVILMTAFPMRFNAPVREVKALLDKGGLGQVYACNTTNQGTMPGRSRPWFVDRELAGGGAMMDHTVHVADLLRWYLQSEVVEVYAQGNRIIHADTVTVDTGGLILMTFANGVFASLDCSWSRPLVHQTWGGVTLELVGEQGVITVDAFRQNITAHGDHVGKAQLLFWGSDADMAMVAEFVAAIREGRRPAVTGYDGYKALEITLAAYRSAATGQPVRLPLTS